MGSQFLIRMLLALSCAVGPNVALAQHRENVAGRRTQPGQKHEFAPKRLNVFYRLPSGTITAGYLDADGNFIKDPKAGEYASGTGHRTAINDPIGKSLGGGSEDVYEYRSGMLIEGRLHSGYKGGGEVRFIPKPGSKVIEFKDYPMAGSRNMRIYNLPGEFVRQDDKPAANK